MHFKELKSLLIVYEMALEAWLGYNKSKADIYNKTMEVLNLEK